MGVKYSNELNHQNRNDIVGKIQEPKMKKQLLVYGFLRDVDVYQFIPNDLICKIISFVYEYYLFGIGINHCNSKELKRINVDGFYKIYRNHYNMCYINSNEYINFYGSKIQLSKNNIIKYDLKSKDINIISESITCYHCLYILKNNDQLYRIEYTPSKLIPIPINFLNKSKDRIVSMKCGMNHALFLTQNGKVFTHQDFFNTFESFSNTNQQLKCILSNEYIVSIACTSSTSFALNDKGILYGWGINAHNITFSGNESIVTEPIILKYFVKYNIQINQINCGVCHICCMDINGNIYTWGLNKSGQCGTGKTTLKISKPYKISLNDINSCIETIECGSFHTILKDYNDNLWSFGCNCTNECLTNNQNSLNLIRNPHFIDKRYLFKKYDINSFNIVRIIGDYHATFFVIS